VANWLDPKAPTLARVLQQNGYATGHFGKWHLGGQRDVDDAPPITAYGFDESLTNFEGMGAKLLPLTMKPGDTEPGKIWADAERLGKPVTWMQRSKITSGFIDARFPSSTRPRRRKSPSSSISGPMTCTARGGRQSKNGPKANADSTSPCWKKWTASLANFSITALQRLNSATTRSCSSAPTTAPNPEQAARVRFAAAKRHFTKAAHAHRSSFGVLD
jgi:hypothetical protein